VVEHVSVARGHTDEGMMRIKSIKFRDGVSLNERLRTVAFFQRKGHPVIYYTRGLDRVVFGDRR
jgi:hypothetical protein